MTVHLTENELIGIGCALAIFGNFVISCSLNLQKFVHMKILKQGLAPEKYLRKKIWWFAIILMGVGEIGNFMAYGYAPASTVAPLGITTIIANAVIATLFLKERVRAQDLFGILIAIAGAFLIISFSSSGSEVALNARMIIELLKNWEFIVYAVLEILLIIGLLIAIFVYDQLHVVIILLVCSSLASFTVITAKAASGMLTVTFEGDSQLGEPVFYIAIILMVVTAVSQIKFLTLAMQHHDSNVVVPINYVLFTISAIVSGVLFYHEFTGLSSVNIFMFLFGCFLSFVAVYFISANREEHGTKNRMSCTVTNPNVQEIIKRIETKEVQPDNIHAMSERGSMRSVSTIVDDEDETKLSARHPVTTRTVLGQY